MGSWVTSRVLSTLSRTGRATTLNAEKCKAMNIDFKKNRHAFEPVIVDRKELSVVSSAKILGVTLSGDVTWVITCLRLLTKPLRDYTSWFFLKERM